MRIFTTKDDLSGRERMSIEKTISALAAMVAAVVGLLSVFGHLDPAKAEQIGTGAVAVGERAVYAIERVWPLLEALGLLWWRSRDQEDRR